LYLAQKYLDPFEYQDWNDKAQAAKLVTQGREEEVARVDGLIE